MTASVSRWPTEWEASGHHEDISAVKRWKAFSGGAETVTDLRIGGKAAKVRDLTDRSGRSAKGGAKGEAYTFQALSSSIGDTVKNIGDALSTAARKG